MFVMQLACKAMCKMLISIENGDELMVMQKNVTCVSEAMLALPLRLPWTRFYKGLQVINHTNHQSFYFINFFFFQC